MNEEFLSQDENLITFLSNKKIDKHRVLGVFIRMLKNYAYKYEVNDEKFIKYDNREYIEVKRCL